MTQQSEQINELAEALAKAQGQMQNAKKDSTNPHFKSNYADLAAIVTAVKQALSDNALSYLQTTQVDEAGNVTLVTTLAHKSGQWVKSFYPVRPVQANPQGFGSALTYARRYSLAAIAGVAAEDEDDDGNAASGSSSVAPHRAASPATAPTRPAPQPAPAGDVAEFKALVAEASALPDLNDFERKFVGEQHERIRQYGDAVRLPTDKQMAVLRNVLDKRKGKPVDYARASQEILSGPPRGHPAAIDDEIPF